MTYPPPGGYPDDGYGQQPPYPQQPAQGGWGAPGGGYPDQPVSGPQPPAYDPNQPPAFDPNQPPPYDPNQPPAYDPNQPVSGGYGAPASGPPGYGGYGQPPVSVNPMSGPPGYGQQPGMIPPPQQKNNTPMIVGGIVGVIAVIALVAVVVIVLGNKDDDDKSSAASGSETTEAPTSEPATTEPVDDGKIESLSYSQFGYDWTSTESDIEATFLDGWDYTNGCQDFEDGTNLTSLGCEFGSELAWEAEDGDVKISLFYLGMTDEASASASIDTIADTDMIPHESAIISNWDYGKWRIDYSSNIVVVTSVTGVDVDDTTGDDYLDQMHPYMLTNIDVL